MSICVIALTLSGGAPLFIRRKGDQIDLSFSSIASLNGVHTFTKCQLQKILSTQAENCVIVWEEYKECILLIGVANELDETIFKHLLDSIFNAMVLTLGLDDIKSQANAERLKRDLRVSLPLIERLLECVDLSTTPPNQLVDLCHLTECILCVENIQVQSVLDTFAQYMDSLYGCITFGGKVAVATPYWWNLHREERKLITLLSSLDKTSTFLDIPIFLPYKSPDVAFRLVTCTLLDNVHVTTICGPNPDLNDVEQIAGQCFKTISEILLQCERYIPRNFPETMQLDQEILGFLLINVEKNKYVMTRLDQKSNKRQLSGIHRLEILRTFYYESVLPFLLNDVNVDGIASNNAGLQMASETYLCSEYHKCHAVKEDCHVLCVLYTSNIQNVTMRFITQRLLKEILLEKQFLW